MSSPVSVFYQDLTHFEGPDSHEKTLIVAIKGLGKAGDEGSPNGGDYDSADSFSGSDGPSQITCSV